MSEDRKKVVFSEFPEKDQWRILSQYRYEDNVAKFLIENGFESPDKKTLGKITGAFSQANEYFELSLASTLYTSPLLLYYGGINLLCGCYALVFGKFPEILGHGIDVIKDESINKVAEVKVRISGRHHGGIYSFSQIFPETGKIFKISEWKLEDFFSRMPDLIDDFLELYEDCEPKIIPISSSKTLKTTVYTVEKRYSSYLEKDRKSTRLNSSHLDLSRMPSSA